MGRARRPSSPRIARSTSRTAANRSISLREICAVSRPDAMIAQELEVVLHNAFVEARRRRHEIITLEHLLLALFDSPSAREVLKDRDLETQGLRDRLARYIDTHTPRAG